MMKNLIIKDEINVAMEIMTAQCDKIPSNQARNKEKETEKDDSPLPQIKEENQNEVKLLKSQEVVPVTDPTTLTEPVKQFRCCINAERLATLRRKVEDAIKDKKTFTVKGGFQCVRNALLQRGWIERIDIKSGKTVSNPPSLDEVCSNLPQKEEWESAAAHVAKCEKMIMSRLLQHHEVDFYWNMRKDTNEWQQRLNKNKIINRFSRSLFTSKEGLCLLLQQMYWHTEPGVAFVRFPRCYTINFSDQCTAFVEDFRITACISLLKWFTVKIHNDGEVSVCDPNARIPITIIQFAIDRCNEYIAVKKHADLDKDFHKVWDHEWDKFLTHYQHIVHNGEKFEQNGCYSLYAFETSAKNTLKNIITYWPQIELDGIKNIWIMKPGNKCRGRDIILIKDVNDVIKAMNHKLKYVVQKYIERPLLIYKTKFDIRQWFIVTCVQPLTIWMYRDCYLRFSTQKFNLDTFHESVHLTNHAVQHKYTNQERDRGLPDDNMWDNHTFKAYLRQIGQAEKWYKVIYPGMRECIIGSMLASQDTMDRRPNTFELYGADFMIAENFTPWLIEINSCPAMGPTTSVTSRMCPQCFEDLIKVVVDRRRDPKADTGLFEMIYKQNLPQTPPYLGMSLAVRGKKIFKKKATAKHKHEKKEQVEPIVQLSKVDKSKMHTNMIKNYTGPVIGNLIDELHESLFKKTIENINDLEIPPAPQVSLASTSPIMAQTQRLVGTQEQKSRISYSNKQKFNSNVFRSKNTNMPNEKRDAKLIIKLQNDIKLQNRARTFFTNPKPDNIGRRKLKSAESWEEHTSRFLNNVNVIKKRVNMIDSTYISSLTKMLPDVNNKKLFTIGLGYKNLCYKDKLFLPVTTPSNVNQCCLKL